MAAMEQMVLLAGVIVLLYGVAVLAGGSMAGSRPLRAHSRTYGLLSTAVGAALLLVGVTWLFSG